jgi:hypothetical protein
VNPPLQIALDSTAPLFTLRVTLDGSDYLLTFDYHASEDRWYMSIADVNESPLVSGVKVLANWPLLSQYSALGLPPGTLFSFDNSAQGGEPPGQYDLGNRVLLLYFPATATS